MRPNWFLAFPFPGGFVTALPPLPPGFRRFHAEDVHLTIAFLGGCGEDAAHRALRALDEALERDPWRPLDVSLSEVVPMGPKGQYSALSARLDRGRTETERYLGEVRDALTDAAGCRREGRPPLAHVTIARPRRAASSLERRAGLEWARALDVRNVTARLDAFALYTWNEDRGERLFRRVATRPLA